MSGNFKPDDMQRFCRMEAINSRFILEEKPEDLIRHRRKYYE